VPTRARIQRPRSRQGLRGWRNGGNLRTIPSCQSVCRHLSLMRSFFRKQARSPLPLTLEQRHQRDAALPLRTGGTVLGPLETRLLELLWARRRPATVRHIRRAMPELAYTTIMTTLDRLYRKGLLLRDKDGRAFTYAARYTRAELLSELISGHVADLLGAAKEGTLLLSTLVRAVGRTDAALLDELDALVQAERLRLRTEDK
jgi:predicted transcriptional regulator